jgi:hypothetical protein
MRQQRFDHARVVQLASSVLLAQGQGAVSYICDRIIDSMSGDPAVEDLWHAVLDVVSDIEITDTECPIGYSGANTLQ